MTDMRLLNTKTRKLKEFFDDDIESYAILSHTWGLEEVAFQDLERGDYQYKLGYAKIEGCCARAEKDDLEWVWIDTCCINKDSFSYQTINSMFLYIYDGDDVPLNFHRSRWFKRGWTLQELIAPEELEFLDSSRRTIGTREQLAEVISDITNISRDIIEHKLSHTKASVAEKMSWASLRQTSRREIAAYCLLGLLEVNTPLLYGEGHRAFTRLQEAIIHTTYDQTILAWGLGTPNRGIPTHESTSSSVPRGSQSGPRNDHGELNMEPLKHR
ncbi:heterokaryon incompatibility protein-domain-containing protein [Xylariaceae sp. FL0255]|nr:heterokaryon incompatibility protein-domain-containing protein [Xylariaceae sp. FL0255]